MYPRRAASSGVASNGGSLAVRAGESGPQSGLVWSLRVGLELTAAVHVNRPMLPSKNLVIYSSFASAIKKYAFYNLEITIKQLFSAEKHDMIMSPSLIFSTYLVS